ncbi:MAG TPA: outer membrane beta-barrel family protein, partial [Gillisia sp.]|nr:outer membrane beta-barrel family protein [Gillisia sp.]
MKKYFSPSIICIIFLVCIQAFSQNSVKGSLIDQNQNPVSFANVILLHASDSATVYKGAVSDEAGDYSFENIAENSYMLQVSFVGYKNFLKRIEIDGNNSIETIILTEAAAGLNEITITAKNPTVTRSIDRLTFNVENSTLSSGNSWDILKKTPGVILNQGQLQVRNSAVTVYINDKKVQLSASELQSLLESYSAENIKSIEVITNPPAKYDAEGGAILNIITSKALTPGYKGSVESSYSQATFSKFNFGTSHYFKSDKFNLFANYSFSPRKDLKKDDSHINFMDDNGNIFSRWNTDFQRITRSRAHNANVILDYNIDEKNSLSFSSNINISPNRTFNNKVHTGIADGQNQIDSTLITNSRLENDENNLAFDVKYSHKFENGNEVTTAAHYTKFDQERTQDVTSNYFGTTGQALNSISFNTKARQDINIFTAQIDYTGTRGSINFETGAKLSSIDSESGIDFFNAESLENLYDNLADNFLYDEKVYALYASFAKDWEKWSIKAGLRGEFTDLQGISMSMNEVNSQEYFELFPTAYLQHTISENHILTLDYSRRIDRPRYESLNPFRYFLNENNFNAGNPNLRAAISNNFNLNYTLQNQYFFDLYYRDHGKSPAILGFQDNQNLTIRNVSTNLLSDKSYGLDILHGRSITKFWYSQLYMSVFHDENTFLAVESNNQEVTNEVDAFFGQFYNSLTISKDGTFSGNLTLTYVSDYISGSYKFDPMTTLSIGFRKTFWNNRAELSLNFEDILDKTNTRLTSEYLNQDNSFFA